MNRIQWVFTTIISSLITILFIGSSIIFFNQAAAAPSVQVVTPTPVVILEGPVYVSVSGLAFTPVNTAASYRLNRTRQLLTLENISSNFLNETNIFITPLNLPDQTVLTGMTVFGEDFDGAGAVRVRLKRCDHSQGRCITLTETTSTDAFAIGRFETIKVAILNEIIDNKLHIYFLELEITALRNSGLRSVRLELQDQAVLTVAGDLEEWALGGKCNPLVAIRGRIETSAGVYQRFERFAQS